MDSTDRAAVTGAALGEGPRARVLPERTHHLLCDWDGLVVQVLGMGSRNQRTAAPWALGRVAQCAGLQDMLLRAERHAAQGKEMQIQGRGLVRGPGRLGLACLGGNAGELHGAHLHRKFFLEEGPGAQPSLAVTAGGEGVRTRWTREVHT